MKVHFAAILFAADCISAASVATSGDVSGLSDVKPSGGPSVRVEDRYMVSYELMIPGTDAKFEMVPVPGGTFTMGSPDSEPGRDAAEGPQFQVTIEPFWMGRYEVTWAEYKVYMALYGIFKEFEIRKVRPVTNANQLDAITAPTELYEPDITFKYGQEPRKPAVTMTQYAAKQYTKWLSAVTGQQFRLPSEAEWEYACRAGTSTAWHFGDDSRRLDAYAWDVENSNDAGPALVGRRKPNPWGLYDMHGNVAEWVLDEFTADGYAHPAGKRVAAHDAINWPTVQFPRVVRGGSWEFEAKDCRSAARLGSNDTEWKSEDPNLPLSPWWYTSDPARGVGFRLLRPLRTVSRDRMETYWKIDNKDIEFDVSSRLEDGRGVRGIVDGDLTPAIETLKARKSPF